MLAIRVSAKRRVLGRERMTHARIARTLPMRSSLTITGPGSGP